MLSEHLEPITHLAGLHILASFIYCRRRCQDDMAHQLNEAGLYELVLALLKVHSRIAGQRNSSTHRDTLDWLEASQGSSGSPLPDDPSLSWDPKGNLASSKGSSGVSKGNFALQPPLRTPFQPESTNQLGRLQLTTAQTLPPPNLQSLPATTGHSPLLRQTGGVNALPEEEEAGNGASRGGNLEGIKEEDLAGLSGDVTLADQVVLAALEVVFKLASDPHHLQAFRYGPFLFVLFSFLFSFASNPHHLPAFMYGIFLFFLCFVSRSACTPYHLHLQEFRHAFWFVFFSLVSWRLGLLKPPHSLYYPMLVVALGQDLK